VQIIDRLVPGAGQVRRLAREQRAPWPRFHPSDGRNPRVRRGDRYRDRHDDHRAGTCRYDRRHGP